MRVEVDLDAKTVSLIGLAGMKVKYQSIVRGSIQSTTRRDEVMGCLLYTSPSPRDRTRSRMPSSA